MAPWSDSIRIPFWFYQLQRNLRLSSEELIDLQERKLAAVVRHAYKHVPYYRRLFDQVGLGPEDIRTPGDLEALPVTSKEVLRDQPKQALVAQPRDGAKYISVSTSGTTGIPIAVLFSHQESWFKSLITIRAYMETGYRLTDRQAVISRRRDEEENRWWFQKWGIFRKYHLCVFDDLDTQLDALVSTRPQHIHGYASGLRCLAEALTERGITDVRPRVVCSGAEVLDAATRQTIQQGFGVPVIDLYGTIEFGNIAWECPSGAGYHINSDSVVVEFLVDGRPAQPGERAELVCTSLFGYSMPFIRYSIGDVAAPLSGTCSCGRDLPLMGPVDGRLADLIVLPSGRRVSPTALAVTLERIPGIRQYQVIQDTPAHIVVRIVPDEKFSSMTPAQIEMRCSRTVAEEARITVVTTESLPLEPSGKFRVIKTQVQQDAH